MLLYVDLDQFKVVNDTCGHSAGDRLLRDITSLLQTRVRASDTIARLGGDEFGILLERCSLEQAERVADSIRQAIHGYRFLWGANSLSVGASIGVVRIVRDTTSAASVLSAADIACYAAKDGGRNRVQVYERDHGTNRHREMQWVGRIARAVVERPDQVVGVRGEDGEGVERITAAVLRLPAGPEACKGEGLANSREMTYVG